MEWSGALSVDTVIVDEVSERGSMKRMLRCRVNFLSERDWGASTRVRGNDGECKFNVLVVQVVVELEVQPLYVLERRDDLTDCMKRG